MSKYEFIKTSNIVSKAKEVILEYDENYSGEIKELKVRIYPYTVKEKLIIKEATKQSEALRAQGKEVEAEKVQEESTYDTALMVFKKDDPTITIDIIKKMPVDWLINVVYKALEFEGISKEQIESETSKNLEKGMVKQE